MRTIVVTGAQGYVGRHLVSQLYNAPVRIVGLGRSPALTSFTHHFDDAAMGLAPLPEALRTDPGERYAYQTLDLTDPRATREVIATLKPDVVIHLAGALRDEAWSDLVAANLMATTNLVEALGRLRDPPALILGSSGSVYGAQRVLPVAEDILPNPVGFYASSKLIAEIAAKALCQRFGVPLTVARLFNLVGPGLQPRHLPGRLAHQIAAIEQGGLPRRVITGPLSATRDLIDVRDAARLLIALAAARAPPPIINVASGVEVSIRDVAQKLVARSAIPLTLEEREAATAPLGADRQAADIRRAADLGLKLQIPLDQSLDDMLTYARSLLTSHDAQSSTTPR